MKVSINQPAYLPWMGYFERIAKSDLHIVLDHVQFEKNSFINRNKISSLKTPLWLTVPLATSGRFGELNICDLQFAPNQNWQRKHWNSLKMTYAKAAHFITYASDYETLYTSEWQNFSEMSRAFLRMHLKHLNLTTNIRYSSEMSVTGTKSELILNLCREVNADVYLSGAMGKNYLDVKAFVTAGIAVEFQDYQHPTYSQNTPIFQPCLGVLDLLFHHGPNSLKYILATPNHP
jgi:hypothetical protein